MPVVNQSIWRILNVSHSKHSIVLRALYYCALLGCGLLAALILFITIKNGMGIASDSIAYIGVSEHVVTGKGLNWIGPDGSLRPMTHFPPFYPLLLAAIQICGLNSIQAAMLVNILVFGASIILIGWFIQHLSGNPIASLMGSLLAAFSPIMISSHDWAMTEPIFIFLMLLGIALLSKYLETNNRSLLIGVGIIIGMHYLTRYAGLSLIVTSVIAILLHSKFNLRKKLRPLLILLFFSLAPMAIWMIRNKVLAGTFTNRRILWHPPSLEKLKGIFWILWEWISSSEFTHMAKVGMVFCLFFTIIVVLVGCYKLGKRECLRRYSDLKNNHLLTILIVYALIYSLMILATFTFFDASTPLDIRITLPLYAVFLILIPSLLVWISQRTIPPFRYIIFLVVFGPLLISYIDRSADLISVLRYNSPGYGSQTKQRFSDIEEISSLPPDIVIYTNNIEGLYFQFNRYGHRTPIGFDDVTMLEKPQYDQELSEMRDLLESDRAVLVLFYAYVREFPPEWTEGLKNCWEHQGTVLYAAECFSDRLPTTN